MYLSRKTRNNFVLSCILILSLSIYSCDPPVTFTDPQPSGKADISSFPSRLQGVYLASDSSYELIINDKLIVRQGMYAEILFKPLPDSIYDLRGDSLFNKTTGGKSKVTVSGDSLIGQNLLRDTFFNIGERGILRKWRGYYFLNGERDGSGWEVKKLSLRSGILNISSVNTTDDLSKLEEMAEYSADTVPPYLFKMSPAGFRRFNREGGFGENEKFFRITN